MRVLVYFFLFVCFFFYLTCDNVLYVCLLFYNTEYNTMYFEIVYNASYA